MKRNFLESVGENGVIEIIRRTAGKDGGGLVKGIGDDCAVYDCGGELLVASCDMMVEGIHFLSDKITPERLGWKSLAVALSDIAAMGARPLVALMALGLRGNEKKEQFLKIRDGVIRCARSFGVLLAGGDTVLSPACQIISFTVIGRAQRKRLVYRSGARPGHLLAVCGTLGDSAAGLSLLLRDEPRLAKSVRRRLIRAHLEPSPQIESGQALARSGASAMIDVSDGLLRDLSHICRESGVGADLDADSIPQSLDLIRYAALRGCDPLHFALGGGEDYRLLFCLPEGKRKALERIRHPPGSEPVIIGRISAQKGIRLTRKGRPLRDPPEGFDHFKTRSER